MTRLKFACIGECMIELNHIDLTQGTARLGFSGDTLNASIYLCGLVAMSATSRVLGLMLFLRRCCTDLRPRE
jgi:hypothetical protein